MQNRRKTTFLNVVQMRGQSSVLEKKAIYHECLTGNASIEFLESLAGRGGEGWNGGQDTFGSGGNAECGAWARLFTRGQQLGPATESIVTLCWGLYQAQVSDFRPDGRRLRCRPCVRTSHHGPETKFFESRSPNGELSCHLHGKL